MDRMMTISEEERAIIEACIADCIDAVTKQRMLCMREDRLARKEQLQLNEEYRKLSPADRRQTGSELLQLEVRMEELITRFDPDDWEPTPDIEELCLDGPRDTSSTETKFSSG